MVDTKKAFKALQTSGQSPLESSLSIVDRQIEELPEGEVLIKVHYSALNYKDALSAAGHKGITKRFPHTPGIDAAGEIVDLSVDSSRLRVGDEVIVTGFDLGMNTSGGFGQYIRVPEAWVVKKPAALSMKASMMLGTAGITAAMSVDSLIQVGITPNFGDIAVTGATGGVGLISVMLLHHLHYRVVAITGKASKADQLKALGAEEVMDRDAFLEGAQKPLLAERWGGAVDTLGGEPLMALLKGTRYGGSVACCGMAASPEFQANVYPFILRGINLLGIDSANLPIDIREEMWHNFSDRWHLPKLDEIAETITLEQLPEKIALMLEGGSFGRCVVEMS